VTARRLRQLGAALILLAQVALIVRAYAAPVDVFGFQMFPESSDAKGRAYPDGVGASDSDVEVPP